MYVTKVKIQNYYYCKFLNVLKTLVWILIQKVTGLM